MVKDNIVKVRERIVAACSKVNRDPSDIKIVAVSKGRGVEDIKEAVSFGLTDIGENRIQEALEKYNELRAESRGLAIRWHMIGHLQTNKVKDALGIFDLIHSVDSLALAQEINKRAAQINKIQDILIEIKTSPEATKFGLDSNKAPEIIQDISRLQNINIKGLMTIAPLANHQEEARPYFKKLRQIRDSINLSYSLSMGMTDDFEVAIEEGAEIIRIGRGIFES
jgi:pyridoxal phosphate enzyme (YggS family)